MSGESGEHFGAVESDNPTNRKFGWNDFSVIPVQHRLRCRVRHPGDVSRGVQFVGNCFVIHFGAHYGPVAVLDESTHARYSLE
jgi:hypothetical protein